MGSTEGGRQAEASGLLSEGLPCPHRVCLLRRGSRVTVVAGAASDALAKCFAEAQVGGLLLGRPQTRGPTGSLP